MTFAIRCHMPETIKKFSAPSTEERLANLKDTLNLTDPAERRGLGTPSALPRPEMLVGLPQTEAGTLGSALRDVASKVFSPSMPRKLWDAAFTVHGAPCTSDLEDESAPPILLALDLADSRARIRADLPAPESLTIPAPEPGQTDGAFIRTLKKHGIDSELAERLGQWGKGLRTTRKRNWEVLEYFRSGGELALKSGHGPLPAGGSPLMGTVYRLAQLGGTPLAITVFPPVTAARNIPREAPRMRPNNPLQSHRIPMPFGLHGNPSSVTSTADVGGTSSVTDALSLLRLPLDGHPASDNTALAGPDTRPVAQHSADGKQSLSVLAGMSTRDGNVGLVTPGDAKLETRRKRADNHPSQESLKSEADASSVPDLVPSEEEVLAQYLRDKGVAPYAMLRRTVANFYPQEWVRAGKCRDGKAHCTYENTQLELYREETPITVSSIITRKITQTHGLEYAKDIYAPVFEKSLDSYRKMIHDIFNLAWPSYDIDPDSGPMRIVALGQFHQGPTRNSLRQVSSSEGIGYVLQAESGKFFYISTARGHLLLEKIPEEQGPAAFVAEKWQLFFNAHGYRRDLPVQLTLRRTKGTPRQAVEDVVDEYLDLIRPHVYAEKTVKPELESAVKDAKTALPIVGPYFGLKYAIEDGNVVEAVFHGAALFLTVGGTLKSIIPKPFFRFSSAAARSALGKVTSGSVLSTLIGAGRRLTPVKTVLVDGTYQSSKMIWRIRKHRWRTYCIGLARQRTKRGGNTSCLRLLKRNRLLGHHTQNRARLEPSRQGTSRQPHRAQIGSGSISKVYELDSGRVLKVYNHRVDADHSSSYNQAVTSAEAFSRLYGEKSARVNLIPDPIDPTKKIVQLEMKKIDGKSLFSVLKEGDDKLAREIIAHYPDGAETIARELVETLKKGGIVHNDINLGNVIYDSGAKRFHIIDFDSANLYGPGVLDDHQTAGMTRKLIHDFNDFASMAKRKGLLKG
ncbi:serine/threonine-protein kinase [Paraburkholderia humisilvae]|nr:serine/threonine-protein kinase [Paraburkholderia humisilvae]